MCDMYRDIRDMYRDMCDLYRDIRDTYRDIRDGHCDIKTVPSHHGPSRPTDEGQTGLRGALWCPSPPPSTRPLRPK